ncbi:uncharacterized protein LOC129595353 [Paramacrobiotus metropolitanus]|uniref:uncharacterized protein LOC129595353 n=1 Tax=Paramacrobiotus metropolitanus TaxID=2943436 RepID=UPI002445BECF|nr:uncharacterized protein LOC129595353 [Paramacrobiotus metropolitanus]
MYIHNFLILLSSLMCCSVLLHPSAATAIRTIRNAVGEWDADGEANSDMDMGHLPTHATEAPDTDSTTQHRPVADMEKTVMKLSMVLTMDNVVRQACNRYPASSQREIALSLKKQLKKEYANYYWHVYVGEEIPQSLTYTYQGRYRGTCNENQYAVWFNSRP